VAGPQLEGEAVPVDGSLPTSVLHNLSIRPLSFYLHVPYCASRCGYCDFNTYTAEELGGGASRASWRESAIAEVELARKVLGTTAPKISTIFVGGGTPTLLPAADLVAVVSRIEKLFGFVDGIEITTEANPDSVSLEQLVELKAGGFTRISFGMQSAAPNVLKVLERTHTPGRAIEAVNLARHAGFDHINLDLIYGTPGESIADLQLTLDAVIGADVDHISAYALIVEDGTRLARAVERGDIARPDDDDMADKYELIDAALSSAGLEWYEVSNWSRAAADCRHNVHYWNSDNWWGIGPGAHSHIGGVRWWNVKHPTAWTQALTEDRTPAYAREILSVEDQYVEDVLLRMRLRDGLAVEDITSPTEIPALLEESLLDSSAFAAGRLVLTPRGRLLADGVIHRLLS